MSHQFSIMNSHYNHIKNSIQIGTLSVDPKIYGFDFYGIKQDEKILNTDIRKVGVVIKQAYTTQKLITQPLTHLISSICYERVRLRSRGTRIGQKLIEHLTNIILYSTLVIKFLMNIMYRYSG